MIPGLGFLAGKEVLGGHTYFSFKLSLYTISTTKPTAKEQI